MALVRGLVQLGDNSAKSNIFMGKEVNDFLEDFENKYNMNYWSESEVFEPIVMRRRSHFNHPYFKGASSKGITVRTKLPYWSCLIFALAISAILAYGILNGRAEYYDDSPNWGVYWSGLFVNTTSLSAVSFVATKVIYKSWELAEMIHQTRNAKSLSQIIAVVKGYYPTALEICSLIKNPEEVFSSCRSCAFAHDGKGEFEIDEDIYVNDLLRLGNGKSSGFIFGVDYLGFPVVSDMLGRIRQVELPRPVCEKCDPSKPFKIIAELCDHYDEECRISKSAGTGRWVFPWIEAKTRSDKSIVPWHKSFNERRFSKAGCIHIGGSHPLDTEYLLALPTINLRVGSGRDENAVDPRENDEMV